jgi:1,4-dihydroxy-2-naphthoate octaprenyltransferase
MALTWRLVWQMIRPGFLVVTAVACLLGFATAAASGGGFSAAKAVATLVLALVVHAAANVLNDYHDALNGADDANHQGIFPFTGGARLIQRGKVSVQDTYRLAQTLLVLWVPAGIVLAVFSGGGLVGVGLAGLLLAWAYSAPPLQLMARGLGELAVSMAWGLVVVGADYVQRGQFFVVAVVVAMGYALLVANILVVNGFPDALSDALVGKATLVVRLGPAAAAWAYLGVAALAHSWLVAGVWLQITPAAALWGLLSLPLSLLAAGQLLRYARQPGQLRPAIVLSISATVVHGLAIAAGLLVLRGG